MLPSDDRTFPRDWTKFKSTLTWPKYCYMMVRGKGHKYNNAQELIEETGKYKPFIEWQMYDSEVMDMNVKLTNDRENLLLERIEHCPDPYKTGANRPKYELGAPLHDIMLHMGRLWWSREGIYENFPYPEDYANGDTPNTLSYDDIKTGPDRDAFFKWTGLEDTKENIFQDLGNGVMRVLNPTYISFVNDHEIDPWEIETDKIRWGAQFPIGDGKFVTTWRMKKAQQGTGHYNPDKEYNDHFDKVKHGTDRRVHKLFPNKVFPVSGEWFPGLYALVLNDTDGKPIGEKQRRPNV